MRVFRLHQKLLLSLTAGIVMGMTALRFGVRMGREYGFPPAPAAVPAGILILSSLVYPFLRQRKEGRLGPSAAAVVAPRIFWQGLLRYGIALDLAMFGFQKLFRLQFVVPMARGAFTGVVIPAFRGISAAGGLFPGQTGPARARVQGAGGAESPASFSTFCAGGADQQLSFP